MFLTNSLEPPHDFSDTFEAMSPALAHEAVAVNIIKSSRRFTVVIGNPPYAQYSMNLTETAKAHIEKFRFANGQRIRVRNPLQLERNLNDDYVKFLGYSTALFPCGTGVLGMITNRMFLDSESLVGLREWMVTTFDHVIVADLWGSSEESRRIERLAQDENVFDILQGVAISFWIRRRPHSDVAYPVLSRELIGKREEKYRLLNEDIGVLGTGWDKTQPEPPVWWLHRVAARLSQQAQEFTLPEIFPNFSTLVASNRDHLVVNFDSKVVLENVKAVRSFAGSNEQLAEKFNITLKAGWNITAARERLRAVVDINTFLQTIEYRPFDRRCIFFHPTLVWQMAPVISNNVLNGRLNLVLVSLGKNRAETVNGQWITQTLADKSVVSSRDNASGFPLYLYDAQGSFRGQERHPNISSDFLRYMAEKLGLPQVGNYGLPEGITPEDIFHYTYAVLYSPTYRSRYTEFLKNDFPVLPLTSSISLFGLLAGLGDELTALHLMESPALGSYITKQIGTAEWWVEKVSYSNGTVWINKAKTCGFRGVHEEVWDFHIGGYQVCEKWLKDRQPKGGKNPRPGRLLTTEDIDHYQKIIVAINETIKIMKQIDEVIEAHGGWPKAFSGE
jgi:predicted helicase